MEEEASGPELIFVPAVRWTDLAEQHLLQIRTRKLGEAVLGATEGLAQFPLLGRSLPEQEEFPHLAGIRDLTVQDTVRVLYEYDEQQGIVWILGLIFPGQRMTSQLFGLPER